MVAEGEGIDLSPRRPHHSAIEVDRGHDDDVPSHFPLTIFLSGGEQGSLAPSACGLPNHELEAIDGRQGGDVVSAKVWRPFFRERGKIMSQPRW